MSRAKNAKRTYNATLCLSSSPHFFYGIVFCFVPLVQLFYFFLSFQKNKCAASVSAAKTMTEKNGGNNAGCPAFFCGA
jgi:hypothetical protein